MVFKSFLDAAQYALQAELGDIAFIDPRSKAQNGKKTSLAALWIVFW